MKTIILISFLVLIHHPFVFSQEIPINVQSILSQHFQAWKINPYVLPSGCIEGNMAQLDPNIKSFYRCNLNNDGEADFAMRLVTGTGSTLAEYFVALVSNAGSYTFFALDSAAAFKGADHRYLRLLRAGEETAIFVDPDSPSLKVALYLKEEGLFRFPIDVLIVQPICESYYKAVECSGYVYVVDRFHEFGTAD